MVAACLVLLATATRGGMAVAGEQAATPAASAVLPASLPLRRDAEPGSGAPGWEAFVALLALTGMGGAWLVWRRSPRKAAGSSGSARGGPLTRLASQALTPQASVHAVRWNGEELLLGCTAQQVTLLSRRAVQPSEKDL